MGQVRAAKLPNWPFYFIATPVMPPGVGKRLPTCLGSKTTSVRIRAPGPIPQSLGEFWPMQFEEQQSVCVSCGHKHKLTAHHKIPQSMGGGGGTNLVGVCRPCHDRIHGVGRGCTDAYPDMIAAAQACAAHWEIVVACGYGLPTGSVRRQSSGEQWESHFAELLKQAMESICT